MTSSQHERDTDWLSGLKNKIQPSAVSKKHNSLVKISTDRVKEWKTIYQVSRNRNQAGIAALAADRTRLLG